MTGSDIHNFHNLTVAHFSPVIARHDVPKQSSVASEAWQSLLGLPHNVRNDILIILRLR